MLLHFIHINVFRLNIYIYLFIKFIERFIAFEPNRQVFLLFCAQIYDIFHHLRWRKNLWCTIPFYPVGKWNKNNENCSCTVNESINLCLPLAMGPWIYFFSIISTGSRPTWPFAFRSNPIAPQCVTTTRKPILSVYGRTLKVRWQGMINNNTVILTNNSNNVSALFFDTLVQLCIGTCWNILIYIPSKLFTTPAPNIFYLNNLSINRFPKHFFFLHLKLPL